MFLQEVKDRACMYSCLLTIRDSLNPNYCYIICPYASHEPFLYTLQITF